MTGLAGKVAIVTGGGGAIGGSIARRLAAEGCAVGVFDVDEAHAAEVARGIAGEGGGKAWPVGVDITDHGAVTAAVDRFAGEAGRIDVLVNCAGWDKLCKFVDTEPSLWDRLIAINYRGALNMFHAVVKKMIAAGGGGRIVTISSDAGRVGSGGEAVYAGCKAALIGFSKGIAREVAGAGITVNVVCPGPTDTPLLSSFLDEGEYGKKVYAGLSRAIPMRRLGTPDDCAGIVAFLAGAEAGYITGQVISVSGGLTMVG